MHLKKEDIKFIDTYLSSNVKHIDLRMEMVDHVSTAIEDRIENGDKREFYKIFKDYMIENKKQLLKSNKRFIRNTDRKLIKLLLKSLIKWPSILTFVCVYGLITLLDANYGILNFQFWLGISPLIAFGLFGIGYYVLQRNYKLQRFSAIERLGFVFGILLQVINFVWQLSQLKRLRSNEDVIEILVSFSFALIVAFIIVSFNLINDNRVKYSHLIE